MKAQKKNTLTEKESTGKSLPIWSWTYSKKSMNHNRITVVRSVVRSFCHCQMLCVSVAEIHNVCSMFSICSHVFSRWTTQRKTWNESYRSIEIVDFIVGKHLTFACDIFHSKKKTQRKYNVNEKNKLSHSVASSRQKTRQVDCVELILYFSPFFIKFYSMHFLNERESWFRFYFHAKWFFFSFIHFECFEHRLTHSFASLFGKTALFYCFYHCSSSYRQNTHTLKILSHTKSPEEWLLLMLKERKHKIVEHCNIKKIYRIVENAALHKIT